MGKFKDKFKEISGKVVKKADELATIVPGPVDDEDFGDVDDDYSGKDEFNDNYDVDINPAQKSESFHHMLLENQFKDTEFLIRGYKEVFNKELNKWEIKRKEKHCFTDEESEHILRLLQTHLSTDIKLSYISLTSFPIKMIALKESLEETFYTIADDLYGRYGDSTKQMFMKQMNHDIFVAVMERIQANYSRAIKGSENKHTHNTVKGQESLNNTDRDMSGYGGEY